MTDFSKILDQAKELQAKMKESQEKSMDHQENDASVSVPGGAVEDPSLLYCA